MSRHLVLQGHLPRRPPRDRRAYVTTALAVVHAERVGGRLGALPVEAVMAAYDLAMAADDGSLIGALRTEIKRRMGG